MSEIIRVRLKYGNIEVEIEGDNPEKIDKLTERYNKRYSETVNENILQQDNYQLNEGKTETLTEFLRRLSPQSGRDFAVSIVYFFEQSEQASEVQTKWVTQQFDDLKLPFSNPSEAIRQGVIQGMLEKRPNRNVRTTLSGEAWVRNQSSEN